MKLLIITNSFPKTSESFIFNKVLGLCDAGVDVSVLIHDRKSDWKNKDNSYRKNLNLKILESLLIKNNFFKIIINPLLYLRILLDLRKEKFNLKQLLKFSLLLYPFKRKKFDIVHFEFSGLAVRYSKILNYLDSKIVVSCRGAAEQIDPIVDITRAKKLLNVLNMADLIHCVSKNMAKTVIGFGANENKIFINYPSIKLNKFNIINKKKIKSDKIKIISVGRLHWKKGFNYGILAIKKLIDKGYNIEYKIVGDGPEKEYLTFMINDLKIKDKVFLTGLKSMNFVNEILSTSDIFLLPSLSEGLSNAALEAMAKGLPTVSTNVGGMSEAIIDADSGYLVKSMDVNDISLALINVIKSENLGRNIGLNAELRVRKKFNIDNQIDIFLSHYDYLLSETK